MKKVMTWVRGNLAIVILSLVIVLVLPAAWFGSSMWNTRIRTERQKAVDADRTKLKGVKQISYAGKAIFPDQPAIEVRLPPNEKTIELFAAIRAQQDEQVSEVVKTAVEINSRGHTPLVDGLFPQPSEAERQSKVLEFMSEIVPKKDPAAPTAYERLLASIGAGGPLDPMLIKESLEDARERELERLRAGGNSADLSEAEQKELTAQLVNQRLAAYKERAEQVSVFAGMDIFPPLSNETWPQIPASRLTTPPPVETCFTWQHDYWAVQDILEAVRRANMGPGGRRAMVPDAVVKRIERLTLDAPPWRVSSSGRDDERPPPAADPRSTLIPAQYAESITGRVGGRSNQLYDIRKARLTAVVSLARMPEFFNAIAKTNFMTITDVDLRHVDIGAELEWGYYYGQEAVVRVDLEIETIWLRGWMSQYMPDSIKEALGIPKPVPAEGEEPR